MAMYPNVKLSYQGIVERLEDGIITVVLKKNSIVPWTLLPVRQVEGRVLFAEYTDKFGELQDLYVSNDMLKDLEITYINIPEHATYTL
jgi:hypothetical protein